MILVTMVFDHLIVHIRLEYLVEKWVVDPAELELELPKALLTIPMLAAPPPPGPPFWRLDRLEYRLDGREWTGTPYTAGKPDSLFPLERLWLVSTDIKGGGIGLILSLREYLENRPLHLDQYLNWHR